MVKGLENLSSEAQFKRLWMFPRDERILRGNRTDISQCLKACQAEEERKSDNDHDDCVPGVSMQRNTPVPISGEEALSADFFHF